jgi:hypothetical protein
MATTPTLMFRGILTTTTTTQLYAGTSSGTAIVTNIALTNYTATAATATINLANAGTNYPILQAVTIPANTTALFDVKQVLNGTTNAITGGAGTATAIQAHISGVVIV